MTTPIYAEPMFSVAPPRDANDPALAFQSFRPQMFGIAFRALRNAADAEDIVQDAWVKWNAVDTSQIVNPRAFLTTMVRRLSVNVIQSARVRHEVSPPTYAADPIASHADPLQTLENHEEVERALLRTLSRLSRSELTAFILRRVFEFPYPQIAEILGVREPTARKLVSRSEAHLIEDRTLDVDEGYGRRLAAAFVRASTEGEFEGLIAALRE